VTQLDLESWSNRSSLKNERKHETFQRINHLALDEEPRVADQISAASVIFCPVGLSVGALADARIVLGTQG
jgi:hypothetical protein